MGKNEAPVWAFVGIFIGMTTSAIVNQSYTLLGALIGGLIGLLIGWRVK